MSVPRATFLFVNNDGGRRRWHETRKVPTTGWERAPWLEELSNRTGNPTRAVYRVADLAGRSWVVSEQVDGPPVLTFRSGPWLIKALPAGLARKALRIALRTAPAQPCPLLDGTGGMDEAVQVHGDAMRVLERWAARGVDGSTAELEAVMPVVLS